MMHTRTATLTTTLSTALLTTLACSLVLVSCSVPGADHTNLQVVDTGNQVARWQLAHMENFDYIRTFRDHTEIDNGWVQAAFYIGLSRWATTTSNPQFRRALVEKAEHNQWRLGPLPWHADDQAFAQVYVDLAVNDPGKLEPVKQVFDSILQQRPTNSLEFNRDPAGQVEGDCQHRWCWSDALFMAPPAWAGLSRVLADNRYLDYALEEYQATRLFLFDNDEHLFYRDSRFRDRRDAHGHKVFWSRGNGWVFAGLPLLLEQMPSQHPQRPALEALFMEMAARFASLQTNEGLWSSSLLDYQHNPLPETSGSAFIVFGLAWGVNHGLLKQQQYAPVVREGWHAIRERVSAEGRLGWVQQVGNAPDQVLASDTQLYGSGALLLAASELVDWQRL